LLRDPAGRENASVSRRTLWILLMVIAAVILIWILGYVVFNTGGSIPGSGTGDTITEPTP
jgi:flagellar basal body-associated protein FliL